MVLLAAYFIMDVEKINLSDEERLVLSDGFVELSNGVVYYEIAGSEGAPMVVLVHGFSVPSYVWDPTFKALVEAEFRVLRYDLYGRGFSDRPEVDYDYTLFIEQLEQLLIALEIKEPVSLVGLSYGGPIVAGFANRFPEKVNSLVFVAPQVSTVTASEIFPLNIPLIGEYLMAVYIEPVVLPKTQAGDFYRPEYFHNWEEMYLVQTQYKGFRKAILSSLRNMIGWEVASEYQAIGNQDFETALFWGQEDETIHAEDIGVIQKVISNIEFHLIEDAGHLVHYEKSADVNPLLIEFLRGAERIDNAND